MFGKFYFLNAIRGVFSTIPNPLETQYSFDEITGHLVRVSFEDTEKGETIRLHIVNDTDFYIVSMFVRSRVANAFMLAARNIDLHEPIKFRMGTRDEQGKQKDCLSFFQNGRSIRWYYTQANAGDMPTDAEGKRAFLRHIVEHEVIPILEKKLNPFPYHSIYKPFGSGNGLQGKYFDGFANTGKVIGPVSRYEKQTRRTWGNNRPIEG